MAGRGRPPVKFKLKYPVVLCLEAGHPHIPIGKEKKCGMCEHENKYNLQRNRDVIY